MIAAVRTMPLTLLRTATMYSKILIPLDGSPRAEAILPHALDVARHCRARVVLVQVVEAEIANLSAFDFLPGVNVDALKRQVEQADIYLSAVLRQFQVQGIEGEIYIKPGAVVRGILEVARELEVDLVAMASHGHTGLVRVFYGSVTAGILHHIDRPLLLVRAQ